MDRIMETVRKFVLEEFLPGEEPEALTDSTSLFTSGVLDSLASLRLVEFLEREYGLHIEAHEIVADNMDTLSSIADFVRSKKAA